MRQKYVRFSSFNLLRTGETATNSVSSPFKEHSSQRRMLFYAFGAITLLSLFVGVATNFYVLFGVPFFCLLFYWCIIDFKSVFFLLFACLPISVEVNLPGGFGTDLPTEPLIVGLMLITVMYGLRHLRVLNGAFFRHPITIVLLLHCAWIVATMCTSSQVLTSFKFVLAKCWYVVTFYFLAGKILKEVEDIKKLFYAVFVPLMLVVLSVLIRHAGTGFSFVEINFCVGPFFRNHVSYASVMALFFPFVWLATAWYERWSGRWWLLVLSIVILLVAIQFSYTRAAYVSLILALGAYYVIRWRWMKLCVGIVCIGLLLGVPYLAHHNNYLQYAPNFDKTVMHERFDNLVEATYKMEDISTMERVYRWVAGFQMVQRNPWVGFGPGNFYNFYKSYTVNSFRTYVSDNPEKSSVHSYYLLTTIEQGIFGGLLFLFLNFFALLQAERIYHETLDLARRRILLMAILSFVIIQAVLIINDMVETDKVGSFFFVCLAIITNVDLRNKRALKKGNQ
jgi:O-antigen ligase